MKPELSPRQREVLTHIVRSIQRDGYPPTVSEIMERFKLNSKGSVQDHLAALQKKGYIRLMGTARGIQLAEGVMPSEPGPPIVARISAGEPMYVEDDIVGSFSWSEVFGSRREVFVFRVEGDSMKGAGIFAGDYVAVRPEERLGQGDIGVAVTEDGATVKRIYDEGDWVRLQPENDEMKPIRVSKGDPNFRIAGKVIGIARRM